MDGAGNVAAAKGAGVAAAKAGRPPKADDFKRALARAMEGSGPPPPPAPVPSGIPTARAAAARAPAPPGAAAHDAAFRARIARAESGAIRPGEGYGARNAASGPLGRYQLTPQALRDLGWKDAGGGWTASAARHGVASDEGFLGIR